MIEEYNFGMIRVKGVVYTRDLIIFPNRLIPNWWRKEGHRLSIEDLNFILEDPPEVLIVGTGYYGYMEVPEDLIEKLRSRGIRVIALPTREACNLFNRLLKDGRKVVAALHLTC